MSFSSKLIQQWKSFDLFGVAPSLSFQGKVKQKTIFGGVVSTLIFFYMIFSLIVSFDDMVLRQNPNIVISDGQGRSKGIRFSNTSFNIAVVFFNQFTGAIQKDPSVVKFNSFQYKIHRDPVTGRATPQLNPVPLRNCTKGDFQNLATSQIFDNSFCLEFDHQNATLGVITQEAMAIQIAKCNNATSTVTCKPQSEIDAIFNTHNALVLYTDFYVDPNNFDKPIQYYVNTHGVLTSAKLSKGVRFKLREFEFVNDEGYFLSDKSSQTHVQLQEVISDINDDGRQLFQLEFFMSGQKKVETRTYIKFQQALAGAVSLIRVAMFFGAFFIVPCQKIRYFQDMIQDLFSFRTINHGDNSSKKYQLKPNLKLQGETSNNSSFALGIGGGGGGSNRQLEMQKLSPQQSQFKQQLKLESQPSEAIGLDKSKETQEQRYSEIASSPQESPKNNNESKDVELKPDEIESEKPYQNLEDGQYQPIDVEDYNQVKGKKKPFSELLLNTWFKNNFRCFNNEEKRQFKSGRNKIQEELSILSLIKKLRDLDRLKCLFLDEEQRVLFDNLPLPAVCGPSHILNSLEKDVANKKQGLSKEEKFRRVKDYYNKIAQRPNKSASDIQLLQWFETGDYFN